MTPRGWLVLLLLSVPAASAANPVPEKVAQEFNELPARVVRDHRVEDRKKLEANYGSFGIDLLSASTLDFMADHFDALAPTLVASQGPPYKPSVRLQEWYRMHAQTDAQKRLMITSLRRWLTEPVSKAPQHGSMIEVFTADEEARAVTSVRYEAADLLADWNAKAALPEVRALYAKTRNDMKPEAVLCLRESLRSLEDPAHAGFLVPTARGFEVRRKFAQVCSMTVQANWKKFPLNAEERQACWAALEGTTRGPASQWAASNDHLIITFCDGVVASLSPTNPGIVTYRDNTHAAYRREVQMSNPLLHHVIARIAREKNPR